MVPKSTRIAIGVIVVVLFALSTPASYAQSSPIKVEVDRKQLSTDQTLTLTVTISGSTNIPPPSMPPLEGFNVVSRSSSSQISIVNGVTSGQVVHRYRLQPVAAGSVTIDPVRVTLNGQTFNSEPVTVQVTQGSAPVRQPPSSRPSAPASTELAGQDYFVEAKLDNPSPYLGQQVAYTFRFYRAANIFGQPRYNAPEFTGFWKKQETEQRSYVTQAAGRSYRVIEMRSILFPAIAGPITIAPATLTVPGGLFERSTTLRTQPVSLDVAAFPENGPEDFAGAVGQFSISAEVVSESVKVNEPITLKVTISGQGNIDALPDPTWPDIPGWRAFDSSATINTQVTDQKLGGSRIYERVLVPTSAGDFTIPPVPYAYFDPVNAEYRTLATAPILVSVAPGSAEAPVAPLPGALKGRVERLAADIRHIKPVPTVLEPASRPLTDRTLYWAAWSVPPLLLLVAFGWHRRRQRLGSGAAGRSMEAQKNAGMRLAQARVEGSDPYVASGQALTAYLSDRLDRSVSGLTRSAMADLLVSRGIAREVIERTEACLAASEGGRFAPGGDPAASDSGLVDETEAVVVDLEREFDR